MKYRNIILKFMQKHKDVFVIAAIVFVLGVAAWFYFDQPEGPIDTYLVRVISSEWESVNGENENQNVIVTPYDGDVAMDYTLEYPVKLERGQVLTIEVYLKRMSDKRIYKIVDVK